MLAKVNESFCGARGINIRRIIVLVCGNIARSERMLLLVISQRSQGASGR
jgi:hypothetical protein